MADERLTYSAKLGLLCLVSRDARLTRSDVAVASVLIDHTNPDTRACYPSVATIVAESGVPKSTVLRSLLRLENAGHIVAQKRKGAVTSYDLSTGVTTGTSSDRPTGVISNLRQGPTGVTPGTKVVSPPEPEQKEKLKSNRKTRSSLKTFSQWSESCQQDETKLVPGTDPVFAFAEQAGIPEDYLYLAWRWFCHRYRDDSKRYRDWRAVFRRCVREDWHRCWRRDHAGNRVLTEVGLQLQRELDAEEGRTRSDSGRLPRLVA